MKLIVFAILQLTIATALAKRPYTTPSPFGSVRTKQFKCEYTQKAKDELLYPNFTCYAKAHSRDVSTVSGYVMFRRKVYSIWYKGHLEYKYGTIYRPVINVNKTDACELLKYIKDSSNPLFHTIFKIAQLMAPPGILHPCPYKAGEIIHGYNMSIPTQHMPSLFAQGDYRVKIFAYWPTPGELICEDTLVMSVTSPFKESFG